MARKLRIQFEGAIYHVFNRGNYRRSIFESAKTMGAFRACLFEAVEQAGWLIHAFALMRNHFHLALQTPKANLVEGMHWLQSTFATRFNRRRHENGHLFQGRYHAKLVEPGPSLLRVVNYIHLNPVHAGVIGVGDLPASPWTSLSSFVNRDRPPWLICADWLREIQLRDHRDDWTRYVSYLEELAADPQRQKSQGFESMTRGWAIGTQGWRQAKAKEFGHLSLNRGYRREEVIELRSSEWQSALAALIIRVRKTEADIRRDRKGALWKIEVAQALRRTTTAPLAWIAANLGMGTADSVSHYLYLARCGEIKITDLRA